MTPKQKQNLKHNSFAVARAALTWPLFAVGYVGVAFLGTGIFIRNWLNGLEA